jgi:hypothetical protein
MTRRMSLRIAYIECRRIYCIDFLFSINQFRIIAQARTSDKQYVVPNRNSGSNIRLHFVYPLSINHTASTAIYSWGQGDRAPTREIGMGVWGMGAKNNK